MCNCVQQIEVMLSLCKVTMTWSDWGHFCKIILAFFFLLRRGIRTDYETLKNYQSKRLRFFFQGHRSSKYISLSRENPLSFNILQIVVDMMDVFFYSSSTNAGAASLSIKVGGAASTAFSAAFFFFLADLGFADVFSSF